MLKITAAFLLVSCYCFLVTYLLVFLKGQYGSPQDITDKEGPEENWQLK